MGFPQTRSAVNEKGVVRSRGVVGKRETPTESFAKYITGTLAEKMREAIIKADVGLTDFRLKVEGGDGYAYNAPDEQA